jgi:hypothetical protein
MGISKILRYLGTFRIKGGQDHMVINFTPSSATWYTQQKQEYMLFTGGDLNKF